METVQKRWKNDGRIGSMCAAGRLTQCLVDCLDHLGGHLIGSLIGVDDGCLTPTIRNLPEKRLPHLFQILQST